MPVGKHTDPQIKADIIHEVRELGLPVVEAAAKYGVSSKTIYAWLSSGVVGSDGIAYRLGYLTGRLRAYENED